MGTNELGVNAVTACALHALAHVSRDRTFKHRGMDIMSPDLTLATRESRRACPELAERGRHIAQFVRQQPRPHRIQHEKPPEGDP